MDNQKKDILNATRDGIIEKLLKKWNYLEFVNNNYLNNKLLFAINNIDFNQNINKDVSLLMETENYIYKDISSKIRSGDVDLEIQMIDKVKVICNIVSKKMKLSLPEKSKDSIGEDALMYALENYDGEENFTLYATKIVKEFYKKNMIAVNSVKIKTLKKDF